MKTTNKPSTPGIGRILYGCLLLGLTAVQHPAHAGQSVVDQNQTGARYSPLKQITADNVANLEVAWKYHSGEVPPKDPKGSLIAFEDHPSMIDGNLIVCTPSRRVIALDPQTGRQRWVFDPKDPVGVGPNKIHMQKCRGISHWVDRQAAEGAHCKSRIFLGTASYSLVAIDAHDGKLCKSFGNDGVVRMPASEPQLFPGELLATSNPAIVNDTVVVGSVVADNQRVEAPSGRVLAYDARTGKPLWQFDPVPRDPSDPAMKTWEKGTDRYGAGNVWSSMAVDQEHNLVYLPTTSPSGDFYGGGRPGDNDYTTAIVALDGSTGQVVWHFQVVHHNVFDYDIPTRPMLIDLPYKGKTVPALVQNTKMGLIFVLNRLTGKPLVPVEERPVPQRGAVPGEVLSKTQPFPVGMPTLAPQRFSPDDLWWPTKWLCEDKVEQLNYGPIYTPPSAKGTIFSPSASGGPNWGGGGYDPASHLMVVPSNRVPMVITLIPRDKAKLSDTQAIESGKSMTFANTGSPYVPKIEPLLSSAGTPCTTPPWAALTAVDLVKKKIVWEVPLGTIKKLAPVPIPWALGTPGAGGPLVTAGGVVFIGYSLDDTFRAFDLHTGKVLWEGDLPAPGNSVPVTYEVGGEQYVVIAAGGHSMYNPADMSDAVVAYKLKR